jgi:hypothetical protein
MASHERWRRKADPMTAGQVELARTLAPVGAAVRVVDAKVVWSMAVIPVRHCPLRAARHIARRAESSRTAVRIHGAVAIGKAQVRLTVYRRVATRARHTGRAVRVVEALIVRAHRFAIERALSGSRSGRGQLRGAEATTVVAHGAVGILRAREGGGRGNATVRARGARVSLLRTGRGGCAMVLRNSPVPRDRGRSIGTGRRRVGGFTHVRMQVGIRSGGCVDGRSFHCRALVLCGRAAAADEHHEDDREPPLHRRVGHPHSRYHGLPRARLDGSGPGRR